MTVNPVRPQNPACDRCGTNTEHEGFPGTHVVLSPNAWLLCRFCTAALRKFLGKD